MTRRSRFPLTEKLEVPTTDSIIPMSRSLSTRLLRCSCVRPRLSLRRVWASSWSGKCPWDGDVVVFLGSKAYRQILVDLGHRIQAVDVVVELRGILSLACLSCAGMALGSAQQR